MLGNLIPLSRNINKEKSYPTISLINLNDYCRRNSEKKIQIEKEFN